MFEAGVLPFSGSLRVAPGLGGGHGNVAARISRPRRSRGYRRPGAAMRQRAKSDPKGSHQSAALGVLGDISLDFSWCSLMAVDVWPRLVGGCFLFSGSVVWPVGSPGLAPVPLPVFVLFVGTG